MSNTNQDFGLDVTYIKQAMKDWDVPGLSIAVVKDGQVVFADGFGLLKKGDGRPVNRRSIFTIGSCTKAFTTVAMAILAREKKISFDDPVQKYVPEFSLADAAVGRALTIKDVVTHQSGVEDGAITNLPSRTLQEAMRHVAGLQATRPHRGGFSYNNTLLAVLALVVEKVSGMSWEDFLQSRILRPLGMKDSFGSVKASARRRNRAVPHHMPRNRKRPAIMKVKSLDYLASSAALQSSIDDMANWLKFQLGTIGREILDKSDLDEMHREHLQVEPNAFTLMMHPGSTRHGYGMTWFVRDYGGAHLVQHGGYVDGFTSFCVMGPAQGFGVVVLTNMHNSLLPFALAYRVIDAYLAQPQMDWSAYFLQKRADHRNKVSPHNEENEALQRLEEEEALKACLASEGGDLETCRAKTRRRKPGKPGRSRKPGQHGKAKKSGRSSKTRKPAKSRKPGKRRQS